MNARTDPAPAVRGRKSPGSASGVSVNGSSGHGSVRSIGARVLVLNASYEPINVCGVRRAAVLLLKARAEVIEAYQTEYERFYERREQ